MIHADRLVAGLQEAVQGGEIELELGRRIGEDLGLEALLVRLDPGDEGERIDRQPVRLQTDHLVEAGRELLGPLTRKPIDQIDVDALAEADGSGMLNQVDRLLPRLVPADRFLDLVRRVLEADAQPIETQSRQQLEMLNCSGTRVNLDRHLGRVLEGESIRERAE